MLALFECVALAIKEKGLRGLCEMVPGGQYAFDVAGYAYKLYCERRKAAKIREEMAKVAAANLAEAKKAAEEVARRVASEAPVEERIALELYLTQIPDALRQSLKRPDDPMGKTVPPDFALEAPEDFMKMLPLRLPHFRPGAELPGRSGWRLAELLGTGGFGEVWLARHSLVPHPRAVKFCTDARVRAKLTSHEGKVIARVMARGNHPNVVPLLDAVLDGETPWLMYEFVGGGSLIDLIHRWQALPERERELLAVQAIAQLALAVGTFHRLTPVIVHRDLKPANILLAGDRNQETRISKAPDANASTPNSDSCLLTPVLRITDFGIGGIAEDLPWAHTETPPPMSGRLETSLRGSYTPLYASPQQARGAPPDPRDDVHALGVIAFQMLTGKLSEAPSPRFERDLKRRNVSEGLIELIGDCVDTEPSARPKDAAELAERLDKLTKNPPPTPLATGRGEKESLTSPLEGEVKTNPSLPAGRGAGGVGLFGAGGLGSALTPTALEGGSAPVAIVPFAKPVEAEKWLIPLRGMWFSRSIETPDSPWTLSGVRLPGEVIAKPGEAYRLILNPDTTDDDLAKLRALVGLPGLEAIDLSGCERVTDAGSMHLAHVRGLKAIGLTQTQVTDSGAMLLLTRFPDLEAIDLAGTANVSQAVIPHLARMRKLKWLALPPRADTSDVRAEFAKRRPACRLG